MENIDPNENLTRIVELYKDLVFSICLRLTGSYFVSEDITQETFIAAYRGWQAFDGENERSWICRIAANKCIDWKRSSAVRKTVFLEEQRLPEPVSDDGDPFEMFLSEDIMRSAAEACRSLPEPYGNTAEMYFIKGMTARQISEQRNEKIKTVQTRIRRSREMLKKYFRKKELQNE